MPELCCLTFKYGAFIPDGAEDRAVRSRLYLSGCRNDHIFPTIITDFR